MLSPRRTKHRKQFRPKTKEGLARGGTQVSFGEFGLKAMQSGNVSARQIESGRKAMTHFTKRGGRIWIRIFPTDQRQENRRKLEWVEEKATYMNM